MPQNGHGEKMRKMRVDWFGAYFTTLYLKTNNVVGRIIV
jgi:hypothetical protein